MHPTTFQKVACTGEIKINPLVEYGKRADDTLAHTMADFLRPVSIFYLLWVIVGTALIVGSYMFGLSGVLIGQVLYYFILTIHLIYRIHQGGFKNILRPDILVLVLYTLFHLGYISLYSLNILPYSEKVFYYNESMGKAVYAIGIGLVGFIFGYEVLGAYSTAGTIPGKLNLPRPGWLIAGIIFMGTALVMHLSGLYYLGVERITTYGYSAIQNAEKFVPYWQNLILSKSPHLMTFGIVIYQISSALRYKKLFHSKIALAFFSVFLLLVILEGDRGPVLKFCLPALLIRHYFIAPIRFKYVSIILAIFLMLFAVMSAVRTSALQPTEMMATYKEKREAEQLPWYASIAEMGGSFLVVNITVNDVPDKEPFWKGASWRDALIHMVPFLQGIASRFGIVGSGPSIWITETYFGKNAAGRGFTVAAEGYLNFGFIGIFIETFIFGFFIRWLGVRFSRHPSPMWALIMFGCFGGTIFLVRGHFNVVTNVCAQVFILAICLNMFFGDMPIDEKDPEEEGRVNTIHMPIRGIYTLAKFFK